MRLAYLARFRFGYASTRLCYLITPLILSNYLNQNLAVLFELSLCTTSLSLALVCLLASFSLALSFCDSLREARFLLSLSLIPTPTGRRRCQVASGSG